MEGCGLLIASWNWIIGVIWLCQRFWGLSDLIVWDGLECTEILKTFSWYLMHSRISLMKIKSNWKICDQRRGNERIIENHVCECMFESTMDVKEKRYLQRLLICIREYSTWSTTWMNDVDVAKRNAWVTRYKITSRTWLIASASDTNFYLKLDTCNCHYVWFSYVIQFCFVLCFEEYSSFFLRIGIISNSFQL